MHDWLVELFEAIKELLLYLPRVIWAELVDALISIMDTIFALCPACDLSNAGSNIETLIADLGPALLWLLSWFRLDLGLTLIGGAYLVRFLIRRLPVIG